jgi:hypothetical protein
MKFRKAPAVVFLALALSSAAHSNPMCAWDIFGWFDWYCYPTRMNDDSHGPQPKNFVQKPRLGSEFNMISPSK